MNIRKKIHGLKFQFISYAIGSTFLPLVAIIAVLLFMSKNLYQEELNDRIKKSVKIFKQNLNKIEERLKSSALLFSAILQNMDKIDKNTIKKIFAHNSVMLNYFGRTSVMHTFRILEFSLKNKIIMKNISSGIPITSDPDQFFTKKEDINRHWREMSESLLGDERIEKMIIGKYLLVKGIASIYNRQLEKLGLCVLTQVIDDVFCNEIKLLSGAEVSIYKGDMPLVLTRHDYSKASEKNKLAQFNSIKKIIKSSGLAIYDKKIFHKEYSIGYFPIYHNKQVIALAAVAHDKTRFNNSVTIAFIFLFASLLISLMIIVVFGFYSAKKILSPVFTLVEATGKMQKGELDVRIRNKPNNELGDLIESFNTMAVAVRTQQEFVSNYNITLKDEVENRTRELENAQRIIAHAEKMASLGQLTAGIAHELKNPLNFIKNFAENNVGFLEELKENIAKRVKKKKGEREEEAAELFEYLDENHKKIVNHSKKAVSIIQAMLNQARGDEHHKELHDLNRLIEESINLVYHSIRAKNTALDLVIEKKLAENLAPVKINITQINRVIVNIIDNAIYATTEKMLVKKKDYVPMILVKTTNKKDFVNIEIEDNGIGMDRNIRDKVFEPFFTTKPANKGTGLGMKIVYDIIKDGHGGDIKIDTKKNMYTKILISIPINEEGS